MAETTTYAADHHVDKVIGYPLRRDQLASVRLYFQHWMWMRELGYLVNPQIPLEDGARIADVCCGTGIWLLDVARKNPNTQCDGFDISDSQYPAKDWLPKNVQLATLDITQPIPEELQNQYDVVHVGHLVCVVQDDDPTTIMENLKLMLKPGGYLQWDDSDFGNLLVSSANLNTSHEALDEVRRRIYELFFAANGLRYQWVRRLKKYFEESDLTVLDDRAVVPSDDISLPWTLQHLMGTHEVIKTLDNPVGSANDWWELLDRALLETHFGASMRVALVSCVGQK